MKATSLSFLLATSAVLLQGCETTRTATPAGDTSAGFELLARIDDPKAPIEITSLPEIPSEHDARRTRLPLDIEELNEQLYRVGLLGEVFFDFDRADLTPEARSRLQRNARYLLGEPGVTLRIEGHCDERGTNEYNQALEHPRRRSPST